MLRLMDWYSLLPSIVNLQPPRKFKSAAQLSLEIFHMTSEVQMSLICDTKFKVLAILPLRNIYRK